jgi:RimJ/RimL family protein N-acetyltransferase
MAVEPVTLRGNLVTLEPLGAEHHDGLVEAVKDGRLWELWYTTVPSPEEMAAEIETRLARQAAGEMLPFAVKHHATNRLVGMTSYLNMEPDVPRLEIGATWTAHWAQRTGVNAESKLLLLTHAFDVLGCLAVEFRTHWHNFQSREAILRLGAKQDGVLRNYRRMPDGTLRDTVVYSIIDSEWPTVRSGLLHRLAQDRS